MKIVEALKQHQSLFYAYVLTKVCNQYRRLFNIITQQIMKVISPFLSCTRFLFFFADICSNGKEKMDLCKLNVMSIINFLLLLDLYLLVCLSHVSLDR